MGKKKKAKKNGLFRLKENNGEYWLLNGEQLSIFLWNLTIHRLPVVVLVGLIEFAYWIQKDNEVCKCLGIAWYKWHRKDANWIFTHISKRYKIRVAKTWGWIDLFLQWNSLIIDLKITKIKIKIQRGNGVESNVRSSILFLMTCQNVIAETGKGIGIQRLEDPDPHERSASLDYFIHICIYSTNGLLK